MSVETLASETGGSVLVMLDAATDALQDGWAASGKLIQNKAVRTLMRGLLENLLYRMHAQDEQDVTPIGY